MSKLQERRHNYEIFSPNCEILLAIFVFNSVNAMCFLMSQKKLEEKVSESRCQCASGQFFFFMPNISISNFVRFVLTSIKQAQCDNSSWPKIYSFHQNIFTAHVIHAYMLNCCLVLCNGTQLVDLSGVINSIRDFIRFQGLHKSQAIGFSLSGFSFGIFLRCCMRDTMFLVSFCFPFIIYLLPSVHWYIYTALTIEPF